MKVCDIIRKNHIIADLQGRSKEEVINELIDLLKDDERVTNIEKLRTAVHEREKIMSTGVGKGFAIPHGKTDAVTEIVAAFGKSQVPIDFAALDEQPVYLIFLLVGKDNLVGPHIKLLSRISRMMNKDEFREHLLRAQTPEEIYKTFQEEENNYFEIT